LEQGLAISEGIEDTWGMVFSRTALGKLAATQGDHEQAVALFLQAFQECQNVDALYLTVDLLYNLACSWIENDDGERAYPLLSLIQDHPASNRVLRERIGLALAPLGTGRQPEVVTGLVDRYPDADLYELAAEIVGEAPREPESGRAA
jgi:hypothetical protein